MWIPIVAAILAAVAPLAAEAQPGDVPSWRARDPHTANIAEFAALVTSLRASAEARDSLTSLADTTRGTSREVLEESIWQRHIEIHAAILAAGDMIATEQARGRDVTAAREVIKGALAEEWPQFLVHLQRWLGALLELSAASDAASGAERLAIESRASRQSERLLEAYQGLVGTVLALERTGIDVAEQRAFLVDGLRSAAEGQVTRVRLAQRERASAATHLSRDASNTDLRYAAEAADERFKRTSKVLATAIHLMDRMDLDATDARVALITATGRMTADVFKWNVAMGLLKGWWGRFLELLLVRAPQWLFQGVVIVLTFIAFRALSRLVRAVVRRAVRHSPASELMRATIVRVATNGVMLVGFLVILTQLGVHVAPLLAGLGIAGFVIGFAMQNTLSNFAAGGMILGNQPFDIGDEVEVAGVQGTVKRMSLVSTTILTPDNQTLILPNSTVWGGVIRNRTTQPIRRVDLAFSVGYGEDIEKAERVLQEVVAGHESVLKDPEAVIRLHQLADSSVNFVVRAWTPKDKYWDVYWDLTRAVKLRFDQERITIPFPQREVHLKVGRGGADAGGVTPEGPRHES